MSSDSNRRSSSEGQGNQQQSGSLTSDPDLAAALPGPEHVVLGHCPHGVDLDREFCPKGCRV